MKRRLPNTRHGVSVLLGSLRLDEGPWVEGRVVRVLVIGVASISKG